MSKDKINDSVAQGNHTIYESKLNRYRILKHEQNNGGIYYTIEMCGLEAMVLSELKSEWKDVMDSNNACRLNFTIFGNAEKDIMTSIRNDNYMHGMQIKKTTIL